MSIHANFGSACEKSRFIHIKSVYCIVATVEKALLRMKCFVINLNHGTQIKIYVSDKIQINFSNCQKSTSVVQLFFQIKGLKVATKRQSNLQDISNNVFHFVHDKNKQITFLYKIFSLSKPTSCNERN